MSEGLKKEWFSINMHLGNRYVGSPINLDTEPQDEEKLAQEFNDAVHYRPSSRVGCRAPHVWLNDGFSSLDYFGRGFVLVSTSPEKNQNVEKIAAEMGIPMSSVYFEQPEARKLYEKKYVLVRPDGHVAWRGDSIPEDFKRLLKVVSGHGGSVESTEICSVN
jgi:hypothetical protein